MMQSMKDIQSLFLKCARWEVEQTIDLNNCPYHYFCASPYQPDYPLAVDLCVLLFALLCFLSAAAFALRPLAAAELAIGRLVRERHLLPSGPIALPLLVLIFANGLRIGAMFRLPHLGPALLQLVYASALAFRNRAEMDITYGVLEASTVSGILHASLRLDSVVLRHYTGLEALTGSTLSGFCTSCVCRRSALVPGGGRFGYRGWSRTTVLITSALCWRMVCRIVGDRRLLLAIRLLLEAICWAAVVKDCFNLMGSVPEGGSWSDTAVYASVCALVFVYLLRMAHNLFRLIALQRGGKMAKRREDAV